MRSVAVLANHGERCPSCNQSTNMNSLVNSSTWAYMAQADSGGWRGGLVLLAWLDVLRRASPPRGLAARPGLATNVMPSADLVGVGLAAKRQAIQARECGRPGPNCRPARAASCSRLLQHERRIHREQAPVAARSFAAAVGADVGAGKIEHPEHVGQVLPIDQPVDRAAMAERPRSTDSPACRPASDPALPATARIESRTASNSSRRRFIRHSSRFSGSTCANSGRSSLAWLIGAATARSAGAAS